MNVYQERRRALGHHRACFGGSSSTESKSEIIDARVVGGNDSLNLSSQNSSVSVITTDQGAVAAGMTLGTQAIDAVTKAAANTNATSSELFKGALGAVSDANERLALAYQSGQAGDQTQLKYAGFVVVGLAALAFVATRAR